MDLRRLRTGEYIAAAGGVMLLVSLFLPWFGDERGDTASAWQSYAITDLLLGLLALGAIGYAVLVATSRTTALPVAMNVLLTTAAFIGTLLVLLRTLLNQPGDGDAIGLEPGAFLGILGTLVTLAGAWLAIRDESAPAVTVTPPPPQPAPPRGGTPAS